MFAYAVMLYKGDGIDIDKKSAANYIKMAVDNGHKDAIFCYALMLHNGDGVEKNSVKARAYLEMAAKNGDKKAIAILNGLCSFEFFTI